MNQRAISDSILQLQAKGDVFTRQVIIEQRRVDDIDGALRQARNEIDAFRLRTKTGAIDVLNLHRTTPNPAHQRADGLDPTKQADQNQKKLVSNLEARLNKASKLLMRHSEIMNGNARLKEEINHLRKERTTANEVHAQFEASIHQIRGEISSLMAHASAINDHREELVKTKEDILAQNREAKKRFDSRMDELSEFVELQNERFEESVERAAREGKDMNNTLAIVEKAGNLTIAEEEVLRSRVEDMEEALEKEQANDRAIEDKMKWYDEAFEELKTVSNIDDLDRLVAVFIKQEDEHFSLFNYIQTVNQETDQHLEKTEELEAEIAKYEEEQGVEERQRVAIIRDLHERAEAQRAANEAWAEKVEESQSVADGLAKKAQSICFKIQCDQYLQTKAKDATGERAAGLQALASTLTGQGITVSNIVDYMSLIEQRSMQVISNYTKKLTATDPEANPIRGPPQPPSWELPEGLDFPDVSDDDESEGEEVNTYSNGDRPVLLSETRKEMESKMEKKVAAMRRKAEILRRVTQRGGGGGSGGGGAGTGRGISRGANPLD
ncbi:unnamed protein product [Ectocarpus fasciculatus]